MALSANLKNGVFAYPHCIGKDHVYPNNAARCPNHPRLEPSRDYAKSEIKTINYIQFLVNHTVFYLPSQKSGLAYLQFCTFLQLPLSLGTEWDTGIQTPTLWPEKLEKFVTKVDTSSTVSKLKPKGKLLWKLPLIFSTFIIQLECKYISYFSKNLTPKSIWPQFRLVRVRKLDPCFWQFIFQVFLG